MEEGWVFFVVNEVMVEVEVYCCYLFGYDFFIVIGFDDLWMLSDCFENEDCWFGVVDDWSFCVKVKYFNIGDWEGVVGVVGGLEFFFFGDGDDVGDFFG